VAGTIANLATQKDLNEVNGKLANISDSVAADLVNNENFTSSVLSGLGDTVDGLARRVTDTENTIKEFDGKFVLVEGLSGTIADLRDGNDKPIFVKPSDFEGMLTSSDKIKDLDNTVSGHGTALSGLDTRFVPVEGLSGTIANLRDGNNKPIFVKPDEFNKELINSTSFKELNTRFVPSAEVKDKDGKYIFLSTNDINDEESSLGAALKKVNAAATKAQNTADTASTTASNAVSAATTAQEAANAAQNTADTASTTATNALAGLASKANSVDVVTKSSLAQDLYNKLNKDPGGICDPNADSLKSLLNGTLETCSK
jgi:hypothetical protein